LRSASIIVFVSHSSGLSLPAPAYCDRTVYDPTLCGGCSQAVIDRDQACAWQMIHLDNLQLAAITDCGAAAAQKAERAIKRSVQVLHKLGVPLPTVQQARQYRVETGDMQ
jgi:hypothetical protein